MTPVLTLAGGAAGGAKGYKDAQRLLLTEGMPKNAVQRGLVSKEFVKEAAADMLNKQAAKTAANNKPNLPHNIG